MKIHDYKSGIGSRNFKEIVSFLKKGMAVEFQCGWDRSFKGTNRNHEDFEAHVNYWVEKIINTGNLGKGSIRVLYHAPGNENNVHIFLSDITEVKNKQMSSLLDKDY